MSDIVMENISKSYSDKCVLDNINVTFESGRINCLMGESGIGKTTLLRIVMGLEKYEGCISGAGRISAVFQENRLIEDISAIENIKLVLNGVSEKDIAKELAMLLPEESLYQKVSELSGGMQRRVAIVRAMMSDCDTICMDEPFTGLDDDNKENVCRYIKKNLKGRTAIVVTHDKSEAKALDAKIYLLTSGSAIATIIGNC